MSMNPIVDTVVSSLSNLIDNFFPSEVDKAKAALLKAQVITEMNTGIQKQIDSQVQVIVAEAQSANPLTSGWRPIMMLTFTAIVANNYILYPYLSAFWHGAPMLILPPDMWDLLKIGVGGYVIGRSVEKAVSTQIAGKVAIAQAA